MKNIASLTASSLFEEAEDEKSDNADTARFNLFSVLDGWPIMLAFSPNGDGKNDKFVIQELASDLVESAEIVIVNRYGAVVYTHKNYEEAQADESSAFTGSGLPEGSYFYQLTVHFDEGSTDKRGGVVTIRRSRWR
jgi:gliding motility-associated-like protein